MKTLKSTREMFADRKINETALSIMSELEISETILQNLNYHSPDENRGMNCKGEDKGVI